MKEKIIDKLKRHDKIAWDVDKTLLYGPWSKDLRSFILNHLTDKEHYIITFRNDEQAKTVFEELSTQYINPINEDVFKGIYNLPQKIDKDYASLHNVLIEHDYTKPPTKK